MLWAGPRGPVHQTQIQRGPGT